MAPRVAPTSYRAPWLIATATFLIHNLEEAIAGLPAWEMVHPVLPWMNWMASGKAFLVALGVLSVGVSLTALVAACVRPGWSRIALRMLAIILLLNAASHLALSIVTRSLMPGVITALFIVFPVMLWIIWTTRTSSPRGNAV